jgi:hypothetical protein
VGSPTYQLFMVAILQHVRPKFGADPKLCLATTAPATHHMASVRSRLKMTDPNITLWRGLLYKDQHTECVQASTLLQSPCVMPHHYNLYLASTSLDLQEALPVELFRLPGTYACRRR